MRLWSIHPKYLDAKGLVALWRESLLANNVLKSRTIGYKNHPQLIRFKCSTNPIAAINYYLKYVWLEAIKRNYNFDSTKFIDIDIIEKIKVNKGQLYYEKEHLQNKLKIRDVNCYNLLINTTQIEPHPLFYIIEGDIEKWEKT